MTVRPIRPPFSKSFRSTHGIKSKLLNVLDFAGSRLGLKVRLPANKRAAELYLGAEGPQSRADALEARLRDITAEKTRLEEDLARRDSEISTVSKLLHSSELAEQRQKNDVDWLVSLNLLFMCRPTWWFILLPQIQRRLVHGRARRRKLFDAKRYAARYPDVVKSGQDPLVHYVRHGMWEGRVNDFRS